MRLYKNVHVLRPGSFTDANGKRVDITNEFMEALIASYAESGHRAPVTLGHPKDNEPAYGWVKQCSLADKGMYCDMEVTDELAEIIEKKMFAERSVSFYDSTPPVLRHIGFLGAVPPAIKGLEPLHFSEEVGDIIILSDTVDEEILGILSSGDSPYTADTIDAVSNLYVSDDGTEIEGELTTTDGEQVTFMLRRDDSGSWSREFNAKVVEDEVPAPADFAEIVSLKERVQQLEQEQRLTKVRQFTDKIYAERKLSEGIFSSDELAQLLLLLHDTAADTLLRKLLMKLPQLWDGDALPEPMPDAAASGLATPSGVNFSETSIGLHNRAVQLCAERGWSPKNNAQYIRAITEVNEQH